MTLDRMKDKAEEEFGPRKGLRQEVKTIFEEFGPNWQDCEHKIKNAHAKLSKPTKAPSTAKSAKTPAKTTSKRPLAYSKNSTTSKSLPIPSRAEPSRTEPNRSSLSAERDASRKSVSKEGKETQVLQHSSFIIPLYPHDSLELLTEGRLVNEHAKAIAAAKVSVLSATYTAGDKNWQSSITEAARRLPGKVIVLFSEDTETEYLGKLFRAKGVIFILCKNHAKVTICDEEIVVLGTGNFVAVNTNVDIGIRLHSKAAAVGILNHFFTTFRTELEQHESFRMPTVRP